MTWGGTLSAFTAYQSNTNTFFATTKTIGTIGPQGTTSGAVPRVTAPYSLTEVISISGVGATSYSGDASLDLLNRLLFFFLAAWS
jgi:hypothetical protein